MKILFKFKYFLLFCSLSFLSAVALAKEDVIYPIFANAVSLPIRDLKVTDVVYNQTKDAFDIKYCAENVKINKYLELLFYVDETKKSELVRLTSACGTYTTKQLYNYGIGDNLSHLADSYTIIVQIDPQGRYSKLETNTANNILTKEVFITSTAPDFYIGQTSYTWESDTIDIEFCANSAQKYVGLSVPVYVEAEQYPVDGGISGINDSIAINDILNSGSGCFKKGYRPYTLGIGDEDYHERSLIKKVSSTINVNNYFLDSNSVNNTALVNNLEVKASMDLYLPDYDGDFEADGIKYIEATDSFEVEYCAVRGVDEVNLIFRKFENGTLKTQFSEYLPTPENGCEIFSKTAFEMEIGEVNGWHEAGTYDFTVNLYPHNKVDYAEFDEENNYSEKTLDVPENPLDFRVTSISFPTDLPKDDYYYGALKVEYCADATINNHENSPIMNIYVEGELKASTRGLTDYEAFSDGEGSYETADNPGCGNFYIGAYYQLGMGHKVAKTYDVTVTIDEPNDFPEADETNNSRQADIYVPDLFDYENAPNYKITDINYDKSVNKFRVYYDLGDILNDQIILRFEITANGITQVINGDSSSTMKPLPEVSGDSYDICLFGPIGFVYSSDITNFFGIPSTAQSMFVQVVINSDQIYNEANQEDNLFEKDVIINIFNDNDADGVDDDIDNCPAIYNPDQRDVDSDGTGDACDSGDYDGDGLSEMEEYDFNTSPSNADTDGDALSDGIEVKTINTNPLVKDTDGDGLDDGKEVNTTKTDPLKQDTDGDTLNDGVEVNNIGTNPLKRDTDSDGLDDNIELANTHTNPLNSDTDSDGYSDGVEIANGTDPNNSSSYPQGEDADSDGYTEAGGDCDDGNAGINQDAEEVIDGVDNNCNEKKDLYEISSLYYVSPFIDPVTVYDASSNGNNATKIGDTIITNDVLEFNGAGYLGVGQENGSLDATDKLTFYAHFVTTGLGDPNKPVLVLITKQQNIPALNVNWSVRLLYTGEPQIFYSTKTGYVTYNLPYIVKNGEDIKLAVSVDVTAGTITSVVNGVLYNNVITEPLIPNNYLVTVGALNRDGANDITFQFKGDIFEMAVSTFYIAESNELTW